MTDFQGSTLLSLFFEKVRLQLKYIFNAVGRARTMNLKINKIKQQYEEDCLFAL